MTTDLTKNATPQRHWPLPVLSAALVALPFLFPFTAGPSANVWQLLASWACVALLLLAGPVVWPGWRLTAGLALTTLLIVASPGAQFEGWLAASGALAVIGLAAAVGAGWARSGWTASGSLIDDRGAGGALGVGDCMIGSGAGGGRVLAWGLLGAGLVSAVLGLLQYGQWAGPLVPWTTTPEAGQAYGNLRQRNQFATLISMALMAGLWLYAARGRPLALSALAAPSASGAVLHRRARGAFAWAASALLLVLAAAASTSRTGLLQWLAISAVTAWMAWRERRAGAVARLSRVAGHGSGWQLPHPLLLLALMPAYLAAAGLLPLLVGPEVEDMLRRLREGAPEGHSRVLLWRNVLELIAQHPWRGWGWGELSYAHYSHEYAGARFVEILDNAHNLPLHLAVELGVPAALLIVGGLMWPVLAARPWRERDATRLLAWGVLGVIGLHSLLEYPLWYGPFQLVFGLCLGWLWPGRASTSVFVFASVPASAMEWRASVPPTRRRSALIALALLAVVGYTGWDYMRISQIYLAADERLPGYRNDTLTKLQGSWFYASSVRFATLTLMPVTHDDALSVHALAERSLHFSPEPRVLIPFIDSAHLLGRDAEAATQARRFKRAFPKEYAQWAQDKSWLQRDQ